MAEKKKPAAKKPTSVKKQPTAKKAPPKKKQGINPPEQATPIVKPSNGMGGFVLTIAIAVLLLLMCFLKDVAFLGKTVRPIFCGVFGDVGLIVCPLFLINILVTWFDDRKHDRVAAKWWFSAICMFFLLVVCHYFTTNTAEERDFGANMWALGKNGVGTGIIGGYGFASFEALMGKTATLCVLIPAFFLLLPLLFNSTPLRVGRTIVNSLRTATVQVSENDIDDEEEIGPVVNDDTKGRNGTELRKPKQKAEKRRGFEFPDEEDTSKHVATIPEQIELNRTKQNKTEETKTAYTVRDDRAEAAFTESEAKDRVIETPYEELTSQATVFEEQPAETLEKTAEETKTVEEAKQNETEAVTETIAEESEEKVKESSKEAKSEEKEADKPEEQVETVYMFPPLSLLAPKEQGKGGFSPEEIKRTSELLEQTLLDFGVRAKVVNTSSGPSLTRYEVQPDPGVRVRTIANLSDDIALHLAATSIRMEAPIPGKSAVGIEVPNKNTNIVRLRELIESPAFTDEQSKLYCCLGADVVGNPVYLDVAKMPHLLIAGATGMGKSVCINSLIVSLLYRAKPDEVKLILIDPKKVEFTDYNGIPHLLVPVVTEPKKAAGTLTWAVMEMERRFSEIQDVGARNLEEYNAMTEGDPEKEYMPQVVIVIDELADLMMTAPTEVENSICRLAQKARAAGMHLIIGTQRPSVDVITGLIKANIPSRIACKVASQVDSRTILDVAGAEKLLGKGDMLYNPVGVMKALRVQGAFVSGKEVIAVCTYLRTAAQAQYNETVMELIEKEAQLCGVKPSKRGSAAEEGGEVSESDPLEMQALEIAVENDTISTSLIQRRLSIGYSRAARIIDSLVVKGFVGDFDAAAKKRKVFVTKEALMQMKMNKADEGAGDE